ncbi:hypothetical protein PCCS19_00480 [Paenibacillus sp. CCS19]|uniref:acyl carrier protein n=1 Tax=Paenibacillus sp. CCS19 TaxID=3158387 RepID=UPI00256BAD5E|nr:acyl carrier protein [Paenibacillus cellulosilyticus]GMK36995.1 hypothetical protein PCCS19_00480 [Paenibacillus cellulosilyticus]
MSKLEELQSYITEVCVTKMNMEAPQEINLEDNVEKMFQLDSISMMELIVNLEERYGCKVPDEDLAELGLKSLPELLDYLEGRSVHA